MGILRHFLFVLAVCWLAFTLDAEAKTLYVCDAGRMHEEGCTTRKNFRIDCCEARHKALFDHGYTKGFADSSIDMWPYT